MYDIAIIGGEILGFTCAHRLLKRGVEPIVFESHGQSGGYAGYFTKKGFSFDVGATTLVDFLPNGVGGQYLDEVRLSMPVGEYLDYIAWLPDKKVNLNRDGDKWTIERFEKLGNSRNHKKYRIQLPRTIHLSTFQGLVTATFKRLFT